jgi:hypothetical protein
MVCSPYSSKLFTRGKRLGAGENAARRRMERRLPGDPHTMVSPGGNPNSWFPKIT